MDDRVKCLNPYAACYVMDSFTSNSMLSDNPHSGVHEADVVKCLDTQCLNPACNQGGAMVCYALEGNGARPSHQGDGYSDIGQMYTLNTIEKHSVCYSVEGNTVDRASAKHGKGWCVDVSPTLNTQDKHAVCFCNDRRRADYHELSDGVCTSVVAKYGTGGDNVPFVLVRSNDGDLPNNNRSPMCEQPSGELHGAGCVQRYAACDKEK